jgi:predicted MPP superfamily phosphohydrolase
MDQTLVLWIIVAGFLAVLGLAAWYLARRLALHLGIRRRKMHGVVGFLTVYGFGAEVLFINSQHPLASVAYALAGLSLGFVLYLGMLMILVHLLSLLLPLPRRLPGIAALVLAVGISAFATWNAFQVRTVDLTIEVEGLTREHRILQWSDVHLGHYRGRVFLEKLVEEANREHADLLLITGDLFDGTIRLNEASLEPLGHLNLPVYYVEGNHDVYSGRESARSLVEKQGVRVLSNQVVHEGELQLIGLDYMLGDEAAFDIHPAIAKATLKSVLPTLRVDASRPVLLMHHAPYGIPYAHEAGVDLYLAGHTHGGQLFPMTLVNELLFRYNRGLHDYRGMKIFVSEGIGTAAIPMRLGTRSSITRLRLLPG